MIYALSIIFFAFFLVTPISVQPMDSALQADVTSTDVARSADAVARLRAIVDEAESPYERRLWALGVLSMARGGAAEAVDALLDWFGDDLHPVLGVRAEDRLIGSRPASAEIRAELDRRITRNDGFKAFLLKLKALLFGADSVSEDLLEMLGHDDDYVAARASLVIRGVLHDLRPDLLKVLHHPYGRTTDMVVDIIGDAGVVSDEELEQLLALLHDEDGRLRPRVAWALGNLGRRGREHLAVRFLRGDAVALALIRGGAPSELSDVFKALSPEPSRRSDIDRVLSRAELEHGRRWATMGGLAFCARWDSKVVQADQPVRITIDVLNVGCTPLGVLRDMPWAGSNWMALHIARPDGVRVAAEHWDQPPPRLPWKREFVALRPGELRTYAIEFTTRRLRAGAILVSVGNWWPLYVLTSGDRYEARVIMNSRYTEDRIREPKPDRVWNGVIPLQAESIEVR